MAVQWEPAVTEPSVKAWHSSPSHLLLPVPRNWVDKYETAVNFEPFNINQQVTEPVHNHSIPFAIVRLLLNLSGSRKLLANYRRVTERTGVGKD